MLRVTAGGHPDVDALVEDPETGRVPDRIDPDLIQFHCNQRLTAGCVTAAIRRRIPDLITRHDGRRISPHHRGVAADCVVEGRHGFVADAANEAGLLAALRCIDDNSAIHLRSADCPPIRTADQQAEEPAAIDGQVLDAPRAKRA
ncbi:hypothetical protein LRS73_28425 [Methylobacterium currus]|uniref:hypothetical protein n=1 Tax=Methylobacterium currus TaxID=2051553 RepID=UPI001E2BC5E4|nr:hypothetical protein [Methylobacterium currus]UHC16329.1 hypothetical protein LRS73_28425 [Methylobacterium currus]